MKKIIMTFTIIMSVFIITSCKEQSESATKNINDIYEEQGIPVNVRTIEEKDFVTFRTFTSSLKGSKESVGTSMISDTVEEILVEVGDFVEKDQPVIRFPKNNPAANYFQAKAGFNAAEQGFKRIENLFNNSGISRQSYDDAKTQYDVQLANWENVNNMIEVKAPLSGYITRLNVQTSDNINPGDKLFTVSNFSTLSSTVWVADYEIRSIHKGQLASAVWEDITITGVVSQVDLAMDNNKKAFAVQILFDNTDQRILSGITANINIETSKTENSIVLHRNEMLKNQDDWFVYVVEDGHAQKKVIEIGRHQGMSYEVLSGISKDATLITKGLTTVRNNSLVLITEED